MDTRNEASLNGLRDASSAELLREMKVLLLAREQLLKI